MGELEENSTFIEEDGEGPKGLPRETIMHIAIGVQVVIAVIGAIGNAFVLYIFGRRREGLTSTLGILILAGKDLFNCVVLIPYLIVVEAYDFHVKYDFFCKLLHFLFLVHLRFGIFVMVIIAVDRCACVCHTFLHVTKIKRARILILATLLITVAIAVPIMLRYGVYMTKSTYLRYMNSSAFFNSTYLASANDHGDVVYTGQCRGNDIIFTYADLDKYKQFYVFLMVAAFFLTGLLYTATFAYVQYGKWKSQHAGPESRMTIYPSGEITRETPDGASDDDQKETEEKERRYNYREQIHLTLLMFTATLVCYAVIVPGFLMVHRIVRFNLNVFFLYHLHYASNPIVYVCMDTLYRNELKNFFHKTWVRISV